MIVTSLPKLALGLALALTGQAPPADTTPGGEGAGRLEYMKESVKAYTLTPGDGGGPLRPQAEPVFRLGGQGNDVEEGAIFLWADEVARPGAAAQVFLHRGLRSWLHEFTSLEPGALVATLNGARRWWPSEPGVKFEPMPGAPKPAASPAARLRQMRALAAEFQAEVDSGGRGWSVLRLLPTPIARYGKPGASPEDGALFAFVVGTDPEAFLFLEVRQGAGGPEWQYAFAPMSCWALKAAHKGRPVWSLPDRLKSIGDPSLPFHVIHP
jgi:hypothetical protein